ncbi:hypothetical protein EV356DRAFT_358280 [Viridothelium virens]|uniref:Uncharacterized protein n=1 Tax=Viridothelium virens TaxID=1048519 RepID=A0A6A6HIC3_VIRVR|nr:hypothetical protein EV356DRAFT_358280 [Viridothelium virens]
MSNQRCAAGGTLAKLASTHAHGYMHRSRNESQLSTWPRRGSSVIGDSPVRPSSPSNPSDSSQLYVRTERYSILHSYCKIGKTKERKQTSDPHTFPPSPLTPRHPDYRMLEQMKVTHKMVFLTMERSHFETAERSVQDRAATRAENRRMIWGDLLDDACLVGTCSRASSSSTVCPRVTPSHFIPRTP